MPAKTLLEPRTTQEPRSKLMKCLIKEDLKQDGLTLTNNRPEPQVGLDEVKIKVLATAVCGTDKSIYHSPQFEGIRKEMQRYQDNGAYKPIVVGHEFCGIVEEIGEGARNEQWRNLDEQLRVEVGDYVTAEMHLSCGHCALCRTG